MRFAYRNPQIKLTGHVSRAGQSTADSIIAKKGSAVEQSVSEEQQEKPKGSSKLEAFENQVLFDASSTPCAVSRGLKVLTAG